MEFHQLYYFLEVASTQHITKSAEALHISQPSLTKAIHRLEEELQVPLFVPRGRNIVLTEYGKYLQKKASPLMDRLTQLPEEMQTMARLEDETIHLNVLAASSLVTDAIISYKKRHKHINFQLLQNEESELYDIGITTSLSYRIPDNRQNFESAFTEQIYLAVPIAHPLAEKDRISLQEAGQEGFISLMGSRQLRQICDEFCARAGFSPKIIFESDNPAAVKNMIGANMGVGFWPEFTWGRLDSNQVKLLQITEPLCQRTIVTDYRKNKANPKEVEGFYDFLNSYFLKKIKPGGKK